MQLIDQVVSLSLAKQLKEAGVLQNSLFYWIYTDAPLKDGSRDKIVLGETLGDSHWELGGEQDTYSAYTCSELGEMLPIRYIDGHKLEIDEDNDKIVRLWDTHTQKVDYEARAKTEAESRGKMLLYLLTNNLINPSTLSEGR